MNNYVYDPMTARWTPFMSVNECWWYDGARQRWIVFGGTVEYDGCAY